MPITSISQSPLPRTGSKSQSDNNARERTFNDAIKRPFRPPHGYETLSAKIPNRTARVGIVGLGYVGLPLAVEFAKAGFTVTGIDLVESKVARINAGDSYIEESSQRTSPLWWKTEDSAPRRISR